MKQRVLQIIGITLVAGWLGSLDWGVQESRAYAEPDAVSDKVLYQEVVYEFLKPCIDEALADYYVKPVLYDRRDVTIMSIDRQSFYFLLEVEVRKFLGGNSQIGIDYITIETGMHQPRVLKYEHTEGFDFDKKVQRDPLTKAGSAKWPEEQTDPGIYHDMVMRLLSPSIDRVVQDYYSVSFAHDPWSDEMLSLQKVHEGSSPSYRMTVKVIPYSGPHRSVGIDHITFRLRPGPAITMEKFHHVKELRDLLYHSLYG